MIAIGIDLAKSISRISSLPNFLWQYFIFCKKSKIKVVFDPIFEKNDSSANLGEYFFQDLYVSRKENQFRSKLCAKISHELKQKLK